MKKIIAITVSIIITFCAVGVNLNKVRANENGLNVDYGIILKSNGQVLKNDDTTDVTTEIKNAGLEYKNKDNVWEMNNFDFQTTYENAIQISGDTTISIKGTNTIKINPTQSQSSGIISKNASNIKLTIKSFDGTNNPTLNINNEATFSGNHYGIFIGNSGEANTLEILSGTINLTTGTGQCLRLGKLTIKDANVVCNTSDGIGAYVQVNDGFSINGKGVFETYGNGYMTGCFGLNSADMQVSANELNSKYEVIGSGDTTTIPTKSMFYAGAWYVVINVTNTENATYAKITKIQEPEPEPTPSPSKKDESCEKVVGPTWHWNNEKGICEEYATVSTSTRGIDSK